MSVIYTKDQQDALQNISAFFSVPFDGTDQNTFLYTLSGSAGTGKTTLTKELIKVARKLTYQVICVAPTHKARKVLHNIINTHSFIRTPTSTVSSLLGKTPGHSYIGTKFYKKGSSTKMGLYDIIFIDEVSMITTRDYNDIVCLSEQYHKKVLFIGDLSQIPNPSQDYYRETDSDGHTFLVKGQNPAFQLDNLSQLSEIVRNKKDNKLLTVYSYIREHLGSDISIKSITEGASGLASMPDGSFTGYLLVKDQEQFLELIALYCKEFLTGQYKIISYTNSSVQQYNKLVREKLHFTASLVPGDVLMGYNNVGNMSDFTIENGQDYVVHSLQHKGDLTISANGKLFQDLSGTVVQLMEVGAPTTDIPFSIFILDLDEDCNADILEELVHLANLVNRKGSTGADYAKYMGLKSQIYFMENIYKYHNGIYTEKDFKELHPLLFSKTCDVIQEISCMCKERQIICNDLSTKVCANYRDILRERIADSKEISSNETLADQYQILEKDLDYGYAITAHKSQGSTYRVIFFDEHNFNQLRDGWSSKYSCPIKRALERDQLKYVAMTRPSQMAYILSQ